MHRIYNSATVSRINPRPEDVIQLSFPISNTTDWANFLLIITTSGSLDVNRTIAL